MRASLRWLLPSDGEFQSTPDGQRYYLARQGRRVVLRGGDVKAPLANSRINWVYNSPPRQSHLIAPRQTTSENKKPVPRNKNPSVSQSNNNTLVPRNNPVINSSDARARAPLDNIMNTTWYNTSLSNSHVPDVRSSNRNPVPRNTMRKNRETIEERNSIVQPSRPSKKKRNNPKRRERRARERREGVEAFIHEARMRSGDVSSSSVPDRLTQPGLLHSGPISTMLPAVYSPDTLVGSPTANDNSPFQIGPDLGESAESPRPI